MTTENVRYLIDAEERATAKFKAVDKSIDQTVKRTRELGGQAKASTELVGTLANVLGGTQFGAAAGQVAQLTERVSAFSEVAKQGTAGMFAFKAGIVAAGGALAYTAATEITQYIVGLEDTLAMQKQVRSEFEAMTAAFASKLSGKLTDQRELATLLGQEGQFLTDVNKKMSNLREQISEIDKSKPENETTLKRLQSELDVYQKQKDAIYDLQDPLKEQIRLLREKQEREKKGQDFIQGLREEVAKYKQDEATNRMDEIARSTLFGTGQFDEAMKLDAELAGLKAKAEEEKRLADLQKKNADEQIKQQERIDKLYQDQLANIEKQAIKWADGDQAARAFELTLQGLSQAQADQIAGLEAKLDGLNDKPTASAGRTTNTALESRFLSGGTVQADPVLEEQKRANKLALERQKILQQIHDELKASKQTESITLATVGD